MRQLHPADKKTRNHSTTLHHASTHLHDVSFPPKDRMKDLLRWFRSSKETEIPSLPIKCGCMPHLYVARFSLRVEQDGPTVHCLCRTYAVKTGHTQFEDNVQVFED